MKLKQITEARYYRGGDENVPFEGEVRTWAIKMWQALQDDWYNAEGDWEWFEEFGLENPTNTIEELWGEAEHDEDGFPIYSYESAYDWALEQVRLEAEQE